MSKVFLFIDSPIEILTKDDVLDSNFTEMKAVANANSEKQKDLMYVKFVLCHEKDNLNDYWFFKNELEQSYGSAKYKNYNWEHGDPRLGVITDSILVKPPIGSSDPRWRVECGAVIWKWVYPELAQKVAEKAMTGGLRNSMECYYSDYCYVLGDEELIYTREEKPELERYIGRYYDGYKVRIGFINMFFGGAGIVANPADPDAVFQSVANKNRDININGDNLIEFVTNDAKKEVLGMDAIKEMAQELEIENTSAEVKEVDTEEIKTDEVEVESEEIKEGTLESTSEQKPLEGGNEEKDVLDLTNVISNLEIQIQSAMPKLQETLGEEVLGGEAQKEEPENSEVEDIEDELEEVEETPADEAEANIEEELKEVEKEKAERYAESASILEEYLHYFNLSDQYSNLFEALQLVIGEILWADVEDKNTIIADEIMVFVSKLFALLPQLQSLYEGNSEKNSDTEIKESSSIDELKQTIESMQEANEELKSRLEQVQSQYDALKEKIEADKEEAKREALAESRIAELNSLGYAIEGEKKSRIKEKVKSYTDEQYNDFKSLFLDVINSRKTESDSEEEANISLGALNIESKTTTKVEEYEKLANAIFKSKQK